jgi:hypothetical protein
MYAHRRRLEDALATLATLVVEDTTYLALYERMELELQDHDAREGTLGRARALAALCQSATR